MNQRSEFVLRAMQATNFRGLCREYGISAKTGYKWKQCFVEEGLAVLAKEAFEGRAHGFVASIFQPSQFQYVTAELIAHGEWFATTAFDPVPPAFEVNRPNFVRGSRSAPAVQATTALTRANAALLN